MPEEDTTAPAPAAEPKTDTPAEGDKTFTQEELDRIVGQRVHKEREKFGDYEDLKAKATKFDEAETQNQTDLERTQEALAKEKERADAAEAKARQTAIRSEVVAQASKAGAADPNVVAQLIDTDAVTVGDDGQVTGAEEAVKAKLEAHPFLVGKTPPPDFNAGARTSTETDPATSLAALQDPKKVIDAVKNL